MKETFKKIFQFLYGPFFMVLDFFMRSYRTNRGYLNAFITRDRVSSFLQGLAVLILVIWIVVFYFAPEEQRKVLTQEIKQSFESLKSSGDN